MEVDDERRTEAIRLKEALESLVENEGWKILCGLMEQQIVNRRSHYEQPIGPESNLYAHEYMKGEVSGINLVVGFPATIIESEQALLDIPTDEEPELMPQKETENE